MSLSQNISCFLKVPTGPIKQQSRIPTKTHHPVTKHVTNVTNPNYKRPLPGKEAYHFPSGPSYTSPCMSSFWTSQPIRQGIVREDIEHDEKPEEIDL